MTLDLINQIIGNLNLPEFNDNQVRQLIRYPVKVYEVTYRTGYKGAEIIASGADQGRALWTVDIGISVFTNPLIIDGLAIVGDWNGEVTALDLATGERRWRMAVAGPVRGGVASDGT